MTAHVNAEATRPLGGLSVSVSGEELADLIGRGLIACGWFALCDRAATGTTPHPILGTVPTCDRCIRHEAQP